MTEFVLLNLMEVILKREFTICILMRSNELFFQILAFFGSFNAEFWKDFKHGNNSSVTAQLPSLSSKIVFFLSNLYRQVDWLFEFSISTIQWI